MIINHKPDIPIEWEPPEYRHYVAGILVHEHVQRRSRLEFLWQWQLARKLSLKRTKP